MEDILQYANYLLPVKFGNTTVCHSKGFEDLISNDHIVFNYLHDDNKFLYIFKCEKNKYRFK